MDEMGDLVLTQDEVNPVMFSWTTVRSAAIHNHFFGKSLVFTCMSTAMESLPISRVR
jgi:hypothetical protein